MSPRWTVLHLATALILVGDRPVLGQRAAEPSFELRLTSRYVMPEEMVRGLVRVEPHADNRLLHVTIDSTNYYRSSHVQLDGELAARNHFFMWRSLPPGTYDVTVTLIGRTGRRQRGATFEVVGFPTYLLRRRTTDPSTQAFRGLLKPLRASV